MKLCKRKSWRGGFQVHLRKEAQHQISKALQKEIRHLRHKLLAQHCFVLLLTPYKTLNPT